VKKGLLIGAGAILLLIAVGMLAAGPVITSMLPEIFAARARIVVTGTNEQATTAALAHLQSQVVLHQTISNLNLRREWGLRLKAPDGTVSIAQAEAMLRSNLSFEVVRGSPIISIKATSESRDEAAQMANEMASVYLSSTGARVARIIEPAQPPRKAARPNLLRSTMASTFVSFTLAAIAVAMILAGAKAHPRAADEKRTCTVDTPRG
jgi:uncharacterized protein involved in exopolysaccharide biosynthesis